MPEDDTLESQPRERDEHVDEPEDESDEENSEDSAEADFFEIDIEDELGYAPL
jgi:hypothetical protein